MVKTGCLEIRIIVDIIIILCIVGNPRLITIRSSLDGERGTYRNQSWITDDASHGMLNVLTMILGNNHSLTYSLCQLSHWKLS